MPQRIIGGIEKRLSDETGIHKGLKNPWEHSHAGSSPASATTLIIMTFNDICNDPDLWIEHVEQDLDMYNSMNLQERLDFVETLFHYESED